MSKEVLYNGKLVQVEDVTPTWESLVPLLLDNYVNGSQEQKIIVLGHFIRMASMLDRYNKIVAPILDGDKAIISKEAYDEIESYLQDRLDVKNDETGRTPNEAMKLLTLLHGE